MWMSRFNTVKGVPLVRFYLFILFKKKKKHATVENIFFYLKYLKRCQSVLYIK